MYKISTIEKKSVIEKNFYVKGDLSFTIEQCYRWGYFTTSEKPDMENYNPEEGMMIYDYDVDDHSFDDGCWIDFVWDEEVPEEDRVKIESAWEEDWYEGIDELGRKENDSEVWFYGDLEIEDLPKQFEDDEDNIAEGTTRSHVIEDDEDE